MDAGARQRSRPRARPWPSSAAGSSARSPRSNPISCSFVSNTASPMREPSFWWSEASLASALLAPLAAIYGAVAQARLGARGRRAGVPVVCIGNLTVGGAGKTPTALAVVELLREAGRKPFVLSRGYGGSL